MGSAVISGTIGTERFEQSTGARPRTWLFAPAPGHGALEGGAGTGRVPYTQQRLAQDLEREATIRI